MKQLPQRKRTRLQGYSYAQNGAYFITLCTKDRRQILSEICGGEALLHPAGRFAEQEIHRLSERFGIALPKYVIMPNHIHFIFILEREKRGPAPTVSDVVCAFKSITTKEINKRQCTVGRQIWQRSYHDHIIRDEQDYRKIWEYIDTNPLKWEDDCFFGEGQS